MPVGVVAYTDRAAGTIRFGGVVSATVTLNAVWPRLPCASVALQLTTVVPSGNFVPLPGVHGFPTMGPSTKSTAPTILGKLTIEPVGPFASTVIPDGTPVNVGPVVSCTVMVNVPVV
jgi:hypothetical protein